MRFRWGNGSRGGLLQWAVTIAVLLIGGSLALWFFAFVGKLAGPVCPNCAIWYGPTPASPAAVTIPAGGPAAGSPAEGNRFARGVLARVGLAAGARRATSPPVEMQVPPTFGWWPGPDMTDVAAVWRVPLPMAQAVAFFERHPPAGLRLTLADSAGRVSGVIAGTVNTVLEFGRGPVPAGIWAAQLLLSLHSDGAAASFARADIQVAWYEARSAEEYIAGLRAMTIDGPHGTRTFTAPTVIAKIAGLLNGLPAASAAQNPCAAQGGYDVQFAVKRGAVPWTDVQAAQGCWAVEVVVNDGGQPTLSDPGGRVVAYLAQLMR
jgi:hypothetical protein